MFQKVALGTTSSARQMSTASSANRARHAMTELRKHPLHNTCAKIFKFQSYGGQCSQNSQEMQDGLVALNREKGLVDVAGTVQPALSATMKGQGQPLIPPLVFEEIQNPSVEHVVWACDRHGATVLVLAHLLPGEVGVMDYPSHHAVLALGTFKAGGHHWALAMDGNDTRPGDPVMEYIQAYANKTYPDGQGGGECHRITRNDRMIIQTEMARDGVKADVTSVMFVLIDLDHAVQHASTAQRDLQAFERTGHGLTAPVPIHDDNRIRYCKNAVNRAHLSSGDIEALTAVIADHPGDYYIPLSRA